MSSVSTSAKAAGIVLIVLIGLLNFHLPHFVIERAAQDNPPTYTLEIALLAVVLAAGIAAVAIFRDRHLGWLLGILVACVSVVLYLVQETIGLPGLQKTWLEPSRLVSLIVEGLFMVLAGFQVVAGRRRTAGE
jgi:hypothetical protein